VHHQAFGDDAAYVVAIEGNARELLWQRNLCSEGDAETAIELQKLPFNTFAGSPARKLVLAKKSDVGHA
jgi:hypothetical protein